jgi:hypothetical protein
MLGRPSAAGCFAARWLTTRCGDATPPERTPPDRLLWSAVVRSSPVDRPPLDPSDHAGTGRSNIEVGSRSRDRVYTGSTRAPIPIAVLCGLSAPYPRKHLPPALSRIKPREASGQGRWQQRPCARTSAAEQGLEAGRRQRSQDTRFAIGCLVSAAACNGEKEAPVGDDGTAAAEGERFEG